MAMASSSSPSHIITLEEDMANRQVMDYSIFSKLEVKQNIGGPEQFKILGHKWKYRAEGNANIVISLQDERRVIRLPKHNIGEDDDEDLTCAKKIFRQVIFANHIFAPLLGAHLVGSVDIINISSDEILQLNNSMKNIRPKKRLHKELRMQYATSRTDFSLIHSTFSKNTDYCIEIKPKQGWWNNKILGQTSGLCTFCLNQFLKLRDNKISTRSNYCPLDLFSGDPNRMLCALKFLISNPQNNLRIFKDGELVYGENIHHESLVPLLDGWFLNSNSSKIIETTSPFIQSTSISNSLNNFLYIISMALLKPQKLIDQNEDSTKSKDSYELLKNQFFKILTTTTTPTTTTTYEQQSNDIEKTNEDCNINFNGLPEKSLLSRILSAQKLGQWGIESIYSLYRKICPVHNNNNNTCSSSSSSSSSSSLQNYSCPSSDCFIKEKWLDELSNLPITEVESLCIENYLIATTVKDCSIMMTFSPIIQNDGDDDEISSSSTEHDDTILQDLNGRLHKLKIGIADLDPKPVTSIPKHYIRDYEMVQAYKKNTILSA